MKNEDYIRMIGEERMYWKIHTPKWLNEIVSNNESLGMISVTFNIFANILAETATIASRINDSELNQMMCMLTLYEIADPTSEEYDPKMLKEIERLAKKSSANRK